MTYLISYDLKKPGKEYQNVHQAIKDSSNGTWCKPLESVYIIYSGLSPTDIYNNVCPHMDSGDRILIIEVKNHAYWYLDKDVSDYLNQML